MADDKIKPGTGVVDNRTSTVRQGDRRVTVSPDSRSNEVQGEAAKDVKDDYIPSYDRTGPAQQPNESLGDYAKRTSIRKDKVVPKYHKGTDYVPETGTALLKKGEVVLNTKDAEKYRSAKEGAMSLVAGALAHKDMGMGMDTDKPEKKPAKKMKEMRIRHGHKGGYIAEHHHTSPADHPMEEHVIPDHEQMLSHMTEHMGTTPAANTGEEAAE